MLPRIWARTSPVATGVHRFGSVCRLRKQLVLFCGAYVLGGQGMVYETLAQFDLLMKFALGQTGRLRQISNVATCP